MRRRPASTRDRIIVGLRQSAPFSSLQRRIIFFNLAGLAILVVGVLYLNQFRTSLIEQRVLSMRALGQIIAVTIAESASADEDGLPSLDPLRARAVLARLSPTLELRARLYDPSLTLIADTRTSTGGSARIEVMPLPPPGEGGSSGLIEDTERAYDALIEGLQSDRPGYTEVTASGVTSEPEVREAARGRVASTFRVNAQQELILSIALPVRKFRAVHGVLVLSTEGGDINDIVQRERVIILQVFVVAAAVSVILSILLARTIARPIRRLATAADPEGDRNAELAGSERVEIPDMTHRIDEIGDLSASLLKLTEQLYDRIEAIESFAADVAHEIKNPLTSLRSAVETMDYAKTPEQKGQLLAVIKKDVDRLDRLVTDISNASRLDADLVRERMEPVNLSEIIGAMTSITATQGHDRGVSVVTRLPDQPVMIRGLESRLAQVVANLLDNALSFSGEGSKITAECRVGAGDTVRLTVEDEGPGIPPDNLESIFERFYSERPEEGFGNHSGLGLSICRQIVEAHGGMIRAENVLLGGSVTGARFVVDLPLVPDPSARNSGSARR